MKKNDFINQEETKQFVNWLADYLGGGKFKLKFPASRFVPGGIDVEVVGFKNVLQHYVWKTSWQNVEGVDVVSSGWDSTKKSLSHLRAWLTGAVNNKDNEETLLACMQVLNWGGVRGAIPFLNSKKRIAEYLFECSHKFQLDQANLNHIHVERYDSGMTKIHALIDTTGLPIYDSRVGAAIAMLYAIFVEESCIKNPMLSFPSGAARGNQIRNPSKLSKKMAPQFSSISYDNWASYTIKLGWIIEVVLTKVDWFDGELSERMHAFEASLFMIGYDLRCFVDDVQNEAIIVPEENN